MTIAFKVRALTLILLLAMVVFGFSAWGTASTLKGQRLVNNSFQELIKLTFEFNIITNESIRKKSPRVDAQWANMHASIESAFITAKKVITYTDDKLSLKKIIANETQAKELFLKLKPAQGSNETSSKKIRNRQETQTISQINIRLQGMLAEASRASRRSSKRLGDAEKRLSLISSLLMFIFVPIFTASLIFISKRIINPIIELQNSAKRLSAGDYSKRIAISGKNEVSELAQCYNTLAEEINIKVASITDKSDRLRESQQQLSSLNNDLKKIVSDQTKDLQESEYRQRAILESMSDGVITLDRNFLIQNINPAITSIFGYTGDELVGKRMGVIVTHLPGDKSFLGDYLEALGEHKSHYSFPIEMSLNEMTINDIDMYTCIVRDNSERKRTEQMKNEFVSTVSHELRTPLTSINGALKLATSGILGDLPEKVNEVLIIANRNTARLINIINDILDIQKIGSGKMDFNYTEADIMTEIKAALTDNIGYAEEYSVEYQLGKELPNVTVLVDITRLSQIMANLLSNAAKFSPNGGIVTIDTIIQDEYAKVSVTDTGAGIPHEYRELIFKKFSQGDSSMSRQKGGTGLGLSISKQMIETMGGSIDFTSSSGIGTTFSIYIPLANA